MVYSFTNGDGIILRRRFMKMKSNVSGPESVYKAKTFFDGAEGDLLWPKTIIKLERQRKSQQVALQEIYDQ